MHRRELLGVLGGARRAARGTRAAPADLPVQQANKVEMYLNLKTARTLVTVPLPLSGRADEIFE